MKFKSTILSQASGSVGGATFSHNRGGLYIRARSVPNQPNTDLQQNVKAWMADLMSSWVNDLTVGQRQAWDAYAQQVPLSDALGEPRNVGGAAMFVRSNVPRLQAGLAVVEDGPSVYSLPTFTPLDPIVVDDGNDLVVTFNNADDWASTEGGAALLSVSAAFNLSRNYFKGPYRFAGPIIGAVVPPASPATIALPRDYEVGQKVGISYRITLPDGRLSTAVRFVIVVTAA